MHANHAIIIVLVLYDVRAVVTRPASTVATKDRQDLTIYCKGWRTISFFSPAREKLGVPSVIRSIERQNMIIRHHDPTFSRG